MPEGEAGPKPSYVVEGYRLVDREMKTIAGFKGVRHYLYGDGADVISVFQFPGFFAGNERRETREHLLERLQALAEQKDRTLLVRRTNGHVLVMIGAADEVEMQRMLDSFEIPDEHGGR
jgi:hypothetical protein